MAGDNRSTDPGLSDDLLAGGRLEARFGDKYPVYDAAEALTEASRCLYCFDAPCMHACPTTIDIATFIRKIATGNVRGSARTILTANLLGASCARVCPVEVLCEGACVYNAWHRKPIAIGRLQRYAMEHGQSASLFEKRPPTGRSVGLLGGGPASLACAGQLALLGHEAVIYERDELPGGLNSTGVAPYKLNARSALDEVEFIRSLGARIETGVEIGKDLSAEELLERHDAVFLGPGLGPDTPLDARNAEGPGVVGAVRWIRGMKLDPAHTVEGVRRACVIGGGNTALDATRELAQLGVPDVRLVYRRSEAEMSGYRHEWEEARREGVRLVENALVAGVTRGADGALEGLELVRAENGRPTKDALPPLQADLVVVAIGQAKLRAIAALFPGVELDDSGCLVADPETGATGHPRVFAGGDAINGGKEVVNAAHDGQAAARAIDRLFAGRPEETHA